MDSLKWRFLSKVNQVSIIEWLNWGVLFLVIVIGVCLLLPTLNRVQQLEKAPVKHVVVKAEPTQSNDDEFMKNMPTVIEASNAIKHVFELSDNYGLYIDKVIYKHQVRSDENVLRYNFDFGVEGSYLDIKSFLIELMEAEPYLSIDSMSMEREEIQVGAVTALLKLNLFINHE